MPIWQLEPYNLFAPQWEASTYHRAVIVRAPTEEEARDYAHEAFCSGRAGRPGTGTRVTSPWEYREYVHCTRLPESFYGAAGPCGVLVPPGHLLEGA